MNGSGYKRQYTLPKMERRPAAMQRAGIIADRQQCEARHEHCCRVQAVLLLHNTVAVA